MGDFIMIRVKRLLVFTIVPFAWGIITAIPSQASNLSESSPVPNTVLTSHTTANSLSKDTSYSTDQIAKKSDINENVCVERKATASEGVKNQEDNLAPSSEPSSNPTVNRKSTQLSDSRGKILHLKKSVTQAKKRTSSQKSNGSETFKVKSSTIVKNKPVKNNGQVYVLVKKDGTNTTADKSDNGKTTDSSQQATNSSNSTNNNSSQQVQSSANATNEENSSEDVNDQMDDQAKSANIRLQPWYTGTAAAANVGQLLYYITGSVSNVVGQGTSIVGAITSIVSTLRNLI